MDTSSLSQSPHVVLDTGLLLYNMIFTNADLQACVAIVAFIAFLFTTKPGLKKTQFVY